MILHLTCKKMIPKITDQVPLSATSPLPQSNPHRREAHGRGPKSTYSCAYLSSRSMTHYRCSDSPAFINVSDVTGFGRWKNGGNWSDCLLHLQHLALRINEYPYYLFRMWNESWRWGENISVSQWCSPMHWCRTASMKENHLISLRSNIVSHLHFIMM